MVKALERPLKILILIYYYESRTILTANLSYHNFVIPADQLMLLLDSGMIIEHPKGEVAMFRMHEKTKPVQAIVSAISNLIFFKRRRKLIRLPEVLKVRFRDYNELVISLC